MAYLSSQPPAPDLPDAKITPPNPRRRLLSSSPPELNALCNHLSWLCNCIALLSSFFMQDTRISHVAASRLVSLRTKNLYDYPDEVVYPVAHTLTGEVALFCYFLLHFSFWTAKVDLFFLLLPISSAGHHHVPWDKKSC